MKRRTKLVMIVLGLIATGTMACSLLIPGLKAAIEKAKAADAAFIQNLQARLQRVGVNPNGALIQLGNIQTDGVFRPDPADGTYLMKGSRALGIAVSDADRKSFIKIMTQAAGSNLELRQNDNVLAIEYIIVGTKSSSEEWRGQRGDMSIFEQLSQGQISEGDASASVAAETATCDACSATGISTTSSFNPAESIVLQVEGTNRLTLSNADLWRLNLRLNQKTGLGVGRGTDGLMYLVSKTGIEDAVKLINAQSKRIGFGITAALGETTIKSVVYPNTDADIDPRSEIPIGTVVSTIRLTPETKFATTAFPPPPTPNLPANQWCVSMVFKSYDVNFLGGATADQMAIYYSVKDETSADKKAIQDFARAENQRAGGAAGYQPFRISTLRYSDCAELKYKSPYSNSQVIRVPKR